jgi:tRNA (adenine57-N1/adenine58-N1)-methyltransferase
VGQKGRGWCYLLKPTPDLWSLVLRHRTQILYIADISLICMNLELRPGQVVLESGTGSASLTHSLCRAVAPSGHVFTYEFHCERADAARKELIDHGLSSVVTVTHRDIMENGFPLDVHGPVQAAPSKPDEASTAEKEDKKGAPMSAHGRADAIFLDLPGPWKVVENAAACLAPNGRFCSFSPCIEQVQKTCEALSQHGFTEINTIEVLLREYELKVENLYYTTDEVLETTLVSKSNRYKGGQGVKDEEAGPGAGTTLEAAMQEDMGAENMTKRKREGDDEKEGAEGEGEEKVPEANDTTSQPLQSKGPGSRIKVSAHGIPYSSVVTTRPSIDARGHTGYLTFARKFV